VTIIQDKEIMPIPGYEGLYSVSKTGEVYSHKRRRFLHPMLSHGGYLVVALSGPRGRTKTGVHRLVAMAYIDNPQNKETVDHINRIKTDNRVENLRWATPKEQMDNIDSELRKKNNRKGCINAAKKRSRPVQARDLKNRNCIIATFKSSSDAAREMFGDVSKNSLINICARGKVDNAFGFFWTYAEVSV
jgi:hypothetical protein